MRNSGVTRPVLGATIAAWMTGDLAVPVLAEEAIPPAVQRRLEELELKVRTLERQQEVSEDVRTAEKATVSAGADGFALKSTDGAFQLKLCALLHADTRWFFDSDDPTSDDTFTLRRARPYIEGTVFNNFDFRFMPDFAGGRTVIQDAYVDARFLPWLQIKAGKFKTPFGIERLQSGSAIRFVERALPNNLVPNRDIGGELHGELGGGVFSYSLARLNGVNDGRSSDDIGDIDNNVDKDYYGPFGLLWEYVNVAQDVARDVDGVIRSDDLGHDACQIATWYLNQDIKLAFDYEQTEFEGGRGGTAESPRDREDEKVVLGRLQLYF